MISRKNLLLIFLIVLLLGGCGAEKSTITAVNPATLTPWTVMVYMAMDNNLSVYANQNLIDMQKSGSTEDVNIVALVDKPAVTTKRYFIQKNVNSTSIDSPYYDYERNIDSGDVNELKSFINTVCKDYPAQNYMLIMSGHGAGIMDAKALKAISKNICSDDASHNAITVPELGAALKEFTANQTIQILATDACLMAMFEIMYELKDSDINYLVLSEATIPGTGYPFDGSWLSGITSNTTASQLAVNLVTDYYDSYVAKATQSVTLSALNLKKFTQNEIISKYNDLSNALYALGTADLDAVKDTVIPATQRFGTRTTQYYYNYQDLKNFCRNLMDNNIAQTEAAALYNELAAGEDNLIVISRAYTGTADGQLNTANANGISTLICDPATDSYSASWQLYYENLKYYLNGCVNWSNFLKRIAP